MKIKVRIAHLDDLQEIQTLFVETIKSTCKKDYTTEQMDAWVASVENKERWENSITNHYFLIAEVENNIVGFGSLINGDYLDFMYVHKDHLRQGIANLLYDNLKKESLRLGFDRLTS